MDATIDKLSFTSVEEEKALLLAAGGQMLFALLVEWEWLSVESRLAPVLPAIFGILIVHALLRSLQRVQMEGSTVRVLDATTWYLWRRFDLAEVDKLEFCQASSEEGGASLKVSLTPDGKRRWHTVRLARVGLSGDGLLLAAFRARVQALRPDLEIDQLPSHYRDGPRPAREPSKAAAKAARRRKAAKPGQIKESEAMAAICEEGETEAFFDSASDDDD